MKVNDISLNEYRRQASEEGNMRIMMNNIIYFAKVNASAVIPTKRKEDAGYDIFPCFLEEEMVINAHTTVMIPTGIASACSPKYGFILKERGSTGTKGMAQRCGVIDSGYRDAWFVPLTNTTNRDIVITKSEDNPRDGRTYYPYSKAICQALLIEVPDVDVNELKYTELLMIDSERGMGALGSSGK
jgi:dUTP pyrophosphatase